MSVTMVRRSDQNVPEQKGEASPGDISKGKRLRGQPTTRWGWLHLRPYLVASWCGANGTIRSFWKPWGILRPPIGLMSPRPSPEEKWVRK